MALQVPAGAKVHDLPNIAAGSFLLADAPNSPLFAGPPKLEDISQGSIADCFFLSSLMAILSRTNGTQFIENMMVEDGGKVTVRLYESPGKPVFLRTPKRRVQSVASGANVSARTCCWVDVLEACASVFNMSARDGSHDVPMDLKSPSLDHLNRGDARKALTVLLGVDAACTEILDTRKLDINVNPGYGQIKVLFDESVAPNKADRQKVITAHFGETTALLWNAWASHNKDCFDKFLAATDKHPLPASAGGERRPRTIKTTTVNAFLDSQVPSCFHAGLKEFLAEERALPGAGIEPVYMYSEEEHFIKLEGLYRNGWPVVLSSRAYVGTSEGHGAGGEDMHKGMLGGHCYCLDRVFQDANNRCWLLITNPWGHYVRDYDVVTGRPLLKENFDAQPVGQFNISLHDLIKKFGSYAWSEMKM